MNVIDLHMQKFLADGDRHQDAAFTAYEAGDEKATDEHFARMNAADSAWATLAGVKDMLEADRG